MPIYPNLPVVYGRSFILVSVMEIKLKVKTHAVNNIQFFNFVSFQKITLLIRNWWISTLRLIKKS